MLSSNEIKALVSVTDKYWRETLAIKREHDFFYETAIGGEGMQLISYKVDQCTSNAIHIQFPSKSGFQNKRTAAGLKRCPRGIGDIWFQNGQGIWNPISVKFGLVGSGWLPYIVSLKRLIKHIMSFLIDSYYLLVVKFEIKKETRQIVHRVYLVDLLDWIMLEDEDSVVTFDARRGHVMLKAEKFFLLQNKNCVVSRKHKMYAKARRLMELYADGERQLIISRRRERKTIENLCKKTFASLESFKAVRLAQEHLYIS